mmetsp:Transcript_54559/g.145679  ORF Transcript_54559/g.145679 Transcript_54559/m.145679 type:complete len:224 (+) Transcript_54559:771-1442(+)
MVVRYGDVDATRLVIATDRTVQPIVVLRRILARIELRLLPNPVRCRMGPSAVPKRQLHQFIRRRYRRCFPPIGRELYHTLTDVFIQAQEDPFREETSTMAIATRKRNAPSHKGLLRWKAPGLRELWDVALRRSWDRQTTLNGTLDAVRWPGAASIRVVDRATRQHGIHTRPAFVLPHCTAFHASETLCGSRRNQLALTLVSQHQNKGESEHGLSTKASSNPKS